MISTSTQRMFRWTVTFTVLVLIGACGGGGGGGGGGAVAPSPLDLHATLVVPDDHADIQSAIDSLPPEGGSVYVRAGVHTLVQGIHVDRSHVSIFGEPGTIVTLATGVDQPVFLLGTDAETPATVRRDITIRSLEIDGARSTQTSETDPLRPWIRNNGIDVRFVEDLWIEGVNVHDARSGGLVVSWNSRRIVVSDSMFHSNFFDGIALYDSEDIQITGFQCFANDAAGLSLDNDLSDVQFVAGRVELNGDVGVFARDSEDLSFQNLAIVENASDGFFLSHQSPGTGTGVSRLFIEGCSILDNGRYGIWLASPAAESPDNAVVGTLLSGNASGAFNLDAGAVLAREANVIQ